MAADQELDSKVPVQNASSALKAYAFLWAPMNLLQGVLRIVRWSVAVIVVIAAAQELLLLAAHEFNRDYRSIDRCLDRGGTWKVQERMCSSPV
jgi:hypothetical protein